MMKRVFCRLFILSLVLYSTSAYKLTSSQYSIKTLFGSNSKDAAKEAVFVGQILRHAATEISQNKTVYSETDADEYFFRSLWQKIVGAIKKAAQAIWHFLKGIAKDIKDATKEIATAVLESAGDTLIQKGTEKALEIVSKILKDTSVTYSSDKYQSNADVVKDISARMDLVGKHLIQQGNAILAQ